MYQFPEWRIEAKWWKTCTSVQPVTVLETVTLSRSLAADNFSSCALITEENLSAWEHHLFQNTLQADSERSTAEGNLRLFPNQQTTKAVVERATETTYKEVGRLCKLAEHAEILKIGDFFQTKLARNSAGVLSIPCWEADRPTGIERGRILRRIYPGSRIGPIKEINLFSKEWSSGIDVKVPSMSNSEILIWVNAWAEEVPHCRQIAAINAFILIENQNNEASEELVAKGVTLIAKGDLEQEHLPSLKSSWSIVPCSRDLPGNVHSCFSKKTAWLTRHAEKRERDGALSC